MPKQPDNFRDVGIIPQGTEAPQGTVRAYFSWGQKFGQYLGTGLMLSLGLGIGLLFGLTLAFPINLLAAAGALALFGFVCYQNTRNEYAWVELDGATLRARHFYSGQIVERQIEEIDDLLTLTYPSLNAPKVAAELAVETLIGAIGNVASGSGGHTLMGAVVGKLLGRVKGFKIRFQDERTPLLISRTDPAMKCAKELMEAVVQKMSEKGELEFEVDRSESKPLIRRIHWKQPAEIEELSDPASQPEAS